MPAPSRPATPISLFYSYSHTDEALKKKLETHLSLLKDEGVIWDWHDRRIEAGAEWDRVINENLDQAAIILLLISADFLASRYCRDIEVARAMERHEAGTARVIPVILRPVDWHSAPFGKLAALPLDGKPVTTWKNRDEAFTDIARGIREVAGSAQGRQAHYRVEDSRRGFAEVARGIRTVAKNLPSTVLDFSPSARPAANPSFAAHERTNAMDENVPLLVVEPPDRIVVEVLDALPGRPISGQRLVRPDGRISLGFYGEVHVAGLTLLEIKEKIVIHLIDFLSDEVLGLVVRDPETGDPVVDPETGKPRLNDPKDSDRIFVDITAYNSKNYYILGSVCKPGRLPYTGGDTVQDALQYAGGVLPSADWGKIRLIRSYPKGSPAKVLPIDYEELTVGTDASTNYRIFPNDRLVVPLNPNYGTGGNQSSRSDQARTQATP
jgi:protein involved in polysaccharide export with SLBB domain